jgi:signal transduction histidine kinase
VHLREVIQTIQVVAHRLHHTLEHKRWDRLIGLVGEVLENLSAGKHHHSIEQSDSEDALATWLREARLTDAWRIAPVLVGAGLDTSALVSLREFLPSNAFGDAVRWVALRVTIQTLLDDAKQCTGRIADLVDAVRSSARQERAETADIDVHEQIRSALGVLDHKLKNVHVIQNFSSECGHVRGYPSELAQVWVNLLDNAADAVNGGGEISLVAREIMRTLATRLRNMEGYTQEREKLIQLGAMAAGLAHELNNPATAARRAAADLRQSVEKVQDYACELNETLSAEQWRQLVATSQEAVQCAASQPKLNSFEQSDREEAIECWLDSQGIAEPWNLASGTGERLLRSDLRRSTLP